MTSNSQPQASELRNKISTNLELIQTSLNHYLAGNDLHCYRQCKNDPLTAI